MSSSKDLPPLHWSFPRLFFHNQFRATPKYPPPGTTLAGQTALITGSNTGLGLESARQLLTLHLSHLILAVRTPSKGEAAAADLRRQYPDARIEVWQLDMASYPSVQSLAQRADNELRRLDMVILNAGIANHRFRTVASTGHEEIVQVNYLSTVLLATLLLALCKARRAAQSAASRLTIVSSGLAMTSAFPTRDADPLLPSFDTAENFSPTDTYPTSKTLGHLWLFKAADYIDPEDVVVSLVDPAYIKGTSLHRDLAVWLRPAMWAFSQVAGKSVRVGASTYVDAVVTQGREAAGSFLMSWAVVP